MAGEEGFHMCIMESPTPDNTEALGRVAAFDAYIKKARNFLITLVLLSPIISKIGSISQDVQRAIQNVQKMERDWEAKNNLPKVNDTDVESDDDGSGNAQQISQLP